MKKVLFVVLLAVPILWAGMTWLTSNKTEEVFDGVLAESNQNLTESFPFVKAEKKSFEKGFTSSTAKSVVTLNPELFGDEEPMNIVVNHTIYHGPIMLTPNGVKTGSSYVYTTLDQDSLSTEVKDLIKLLFDGKEPVISGVQTGIGGDINVDLEVAPLSFDAKKYKTLTGKEPDPDDPNFISFSGINGHVTTNTEGSRLDGFLNLGALEMKGKSEGKDFILNMAASSMEMDIDELYKGSILDGSVVMEIPELSFSDGEGADMVMSDLSITSEAKQENAKFGGFGTLDVGKLLVKKPDDSVAFPESKIHAKFGVEGFERGAVIRLVDQGQKMRSSQLMLLNEDDPDQMSEAMLKSMGAYYAAVADTIKQGVGINTNLEISNDTGHSAVKFDLDYADAKKLTDLKTIRDLIMALQGQLKISVDKGMIAGTPAEEAAGMPVAMGFAVDKGESYEAIADLAGGELKVNGEPMPILDMLGGMVDQTIPWEMLQGL